MKTRLVVFTCLAALVWACNSPKTLEELKAERDSLKKELAELEKEILKLDTAEASESIGLLVGIDSVKTGVFIQVQSEIKSYRSMYGTVYYTHYTIHILPLPTHCLLPFCQTWHPTLPLH